MVVARRADGPAAVMTLLVLIALIAAAGALCPTPSQAINANKDCATYEQGWLDACPVYCQLQSNTSFSMHYATGPVTPYSCEVQQCTTSDSGCYTTSGGTSYCPSSAANGPPAYAQIMAQSPIYPLELTVITPNGTPQRVLARNAGLVAPLGSRSTSDCHIYDFARTNLTLTVSLGATADSQPALVRLSLAMGTLLQPVPGGCCTTCITNPVDPTLTVAPTTDSSTIEFLQARLALGLDRSPPGVNSCDACDAMYYESGAITYEIYQAFLPSCGSAYKPAFRQDLLLETVDRMSSVEGVRQYGNLVASGLDSTSELRAVLDSKAGQGSVYVVLATDSNVVSFYQSLGINNITNDMATALYTPYATFGCSFTAEAGMPLCDDLTNNTDMAIAALLLLLGLFLCLFGHRYFAGATVFWSCITYILLVQHTQLGYSVLVGLSCFLGMVTGAVVVGAWYYTRSTVLALIFTGSVMGTLVSAFMFATPLGDMQIWQGNFNYGMAYACFALVWPVLLLLQGDALSMIATSLTGSYMVLFFLDYFVGSDLSQIVTNVLDRATIPYFAKNYYGNIFAHEFNGCANLTNNVAMLVSWWVLAMICVWLQRGWLAKTRALPFTHGTDAFGRTRIRQGRTDHIYGEPLDLLAEIPSRGKKLKRISVANWVRNGFAARMGPRRDREEQPLLHNAESS